MQERGLRFVYNDFTSSYKSLLTKCNKTLLYISRLKYLALFVYECLYEYGPSMHRGMYTTHELPYNTRINNPVNQPIVNTTTFGLQSLKYEGAKLWNSLPNDIKDAISLTQFKALIKTWSGPQCTCNICTVCKVSNI